MKTLLLAVSFLYAFSTNARNFYFSENSGNDTYTILQAQSPFTPWKTITKFNAVFASLQPGDSVLFKRGESFYGSIVISRSGTSTLPIIIGAYGTGTKPVITGFQTISNWADAGRNIYENDCSSCATELNMVLLNNIVQPMGRWPKVTDANGGWKTIDSHDGITSITSNDITGAQNYDGGEIVMRKYQWILDRGRINSQTSTQVTYTPFVSPDHPNFTPPPIDGHGFFFQNHMNTLTELGEWCYEPDTKKIKMKFPNGNPNSYSIKAAMLETLVVIDYKNYVRFDNLAFKGSNSFTFHIISATNIQINNCDISFSGVNAIQVDGDLNTNNNRIYNCTISSTNNNAMDLDESSHWTIQNNIINNTGLNRGMGKSGDGQYIGIHRVGAKSLVQYNVIKNTGYHGVHFVGDSVLIKNNFIDSFCMIKSDGGGIYTYGEPTKKGRRITGNIVTNGIGDLYGIDVDMANPYAGQVHGIYMDANTANVQIDSNTSFNNAHSGLWLGSSTNITAKNNTLYNNTVAQMKVIDQYGTVANLNIKHNILFAKDSASLITAFKLSYDYLNAIGTIDSNYYCRPLYEPTGINTQGYPNVPTLHNYPGGGIVDSYDSRFYSLDTWKTLSSQDAHTKITQSTTVDANDIRFEYNAANANKTINLNGTYRDAKNNSFVNSVTLAPYSSIILIKTSLSVLPLQFLGFEVYKAGSEADLKWTTTNEVNTLLFEIERSSDGIHFSRLDTIHTKNIAQNTSLYNYRDRHPVKGINFYRLKQVDANNDYLYSKTLRISFAEQMNFQTSPNPVSSQLKIVIDKALNSENRYLSIQSLSGIMVKTMPIGSSSDVIPIDMSKFPNGMYIVSLISREFTINKEIVKWAP